MSSRVTLKKPPKSAVSLEAAKVRLGVTGTDDDALIQDLLEGATSRVEGILNRSLRQGLYRETIEDMDPTDSALILGGAPVSPVSLTAGGVAVELLHVEQESGQLRIWPAAATDFEFGALETRSATTTYEAVYRSGWLYDEGARSIAGALVETFTLSADAAVGAVEIAIDAADLADDETGLIPPGASLSFGDEVVFALSSARAADTLTVQIFPALTDARLSGATVEQVDERIPRAIVEEVLALLRDAYGVAKRSALDPSSDSRVSEVAGDGYSVKMRDPAEVDKAIGLKLKRWCR